MSRIESNETEAEQPERHPVSRRRTVARRILHGTGVLLGLGLFAGAAVAGIAALHLRTASESPRTPAPPVSVATVRAQIVDGYELTTRFTGRIEAARETALAFERGGLVVEVLPDEGREVRAGAVIARLDTAKLRSGRDRLEARRRELEARQNLAERTLGRQSKLKSEGWSPDQRFDEAEATLSQLTAAIEQVTAEIAAIDIDIAKSVLKAPFDGTIAARSIDEGAVVAAGTPVATLLETGRRQVRIGLPPAEALRLDARTEYEVRTSEATLPAKLASRRPDLDTGTRTVTVLFDVSGDAGSAALGDLATLEIGNRISSRGTWLPLTALKEGRRGLWTVLVADGQGDEAVVRTEAVEVLHAEADKVFVRGTLRDGDRVISGGTNRVVAGQRIALGGE